jgi:anthranilate synthase component 1
MIVSPDYDSFARAYERGENQIVSTRLVADLETPVSAMLKLGRNARYSFLLESVEGGAVRGRYSIIGLNPDVIWKAKGPKAFINRKALSNPDGPFEEQALDPLASLRALQCREPHHLADDAPPMAAGVFGYLGYDSVRLMEHLPDQPPDVLGLPDGIMIRPTVMAIFDSVKDEVTVTTPSMWKRVWRRAPPMPARRNAFPKSSMPSTGRWTCSCARTDTPPMKPRLQHHAR